MQDYNAFLMFLHDHRDTEVKCSIERIERILGHNLQRSAYKYAAWWSNSPTHPLMKKVLEIGWESKNVDLRSKTITFHRTGYQAIVKSVVKAQSKKHRKKISRLTPEIILEIEKKFKTRRNNQLKQQTPDFTVDGKGIHFEHILDDFCSQIAKGKIEVYNEFSVQFELAIFLRALIPNYKIQLERNVSYFKLDKQRFEKKEIDIVLFNKTKTRKFAIEIKYPLSQEPKQMYKFCEDIKFLEQLKESGFTDNFFLAITSNATFWRDDGKIGTIYEKFRKEKALYGVIKNKIGNSKKEVTLERRHKINWLTINDSTRYFLMRI